VREFLHGLRAAPNAMLEVECFSGGAFDQNGYLVRCTETGETAVVDPGESAPDMVHSLRETGHPLRGIYLTHAHFDHVEGIPTILEWAPVPIHLHPADRTLYEMAAAQGASLGRRLPRPLPPPDEDLHPGDSLSIGQGRLEVRAAPGHAPGHVIFVAPREGFALVGDVIFRGSIGRTDLPGGDFRSLMDSIRTQVLTLPDETRLLPGHGAETTVADERRGNPFLISQAPGDFA
jgi:hydroxyacylglutathione hydrolase